MKKYPVLRDFVDKNTGFYHKNGDFYEINDTERAANLQEIGFIGEEIKSQRKGRAADEHRKNETSGDTAKTNDHT